MFWFIVGVCVGVFADRSYPIPVSFVIGKLRELWTKATGATPIPKDGE